ncbi:MAG: hypothetical protein ACKVOW_20020, partial [Chitinophagaceae bacterium]
MNPKVYIIKNLFFLFVGSLYLYSCKTNPAKAPADYEVASAWADMATLITKTTPSNSPTFASRCFGYIGLTMYESVVNGFVEYQSIAPQLNGLGILALPDSGLHYNWALCLNAGQAEILRSIYIQTSDENKLRIDSLEKYFEKALKNISADDGTNNKSILYGKEIAAKIFEWSKTDSGHRAYLRNFDKTLVFKEKP